MIGCAGGGVAVSAGNAALRHIGGTRIGISGTARGGEVVAEHGRAGGILDFLPRRQIREKKGVPFQRWSPGGWAMSTPKVVEIWEPECAARKGPVPEVASQKRLTPRQRCQ